MSQTTGRRYAAMALVAALHILVLEIIVRTPRSARTPSEDSTAWSTLFFVPAEVVPVPPPTKAKPARARALAPHSLQVPAAEAALPITTTPEATQGKPSIDWMAALQGVATDVAGSQSAQAHGAAPQAHSLWTPGAHHYGEQYTLNTGEKIVWVSDHCYIVSEPPMLGTPNAFAHAALTHTACQGNPGPRADLFEDLPAYKKSHPTP